MPEALLEDLDALDLEAARALVRSQREQLHTQQRKLSSHETEIAHLKLLLDKLRRMLFGAKSEKLVRQVEQLEFQLEELEAGRGEDRIAEPPPKAEAVSSQDRVHEPTRRSLPEHLPREIETHLPEKACCPDSHAYAELLEEHGIVASMSRPANPYDNAQCESFMKTLKQEEIHTRSYRDLPHLEAHIGNFLDRYYNRRRLHSALGYRTPEEFERSLPAQPASAPVVTLSFPRHDGIDRPEERERTGERLEPSSSSSVRCVPAGYSSAGCSPAEPASASPARIKPQTTTPARQEKYSERQTGNFHRVSR